MSDFEKAETLAPADISAVIEMALSDHMPFATIKLEYGLSEKEVQALMRRELKTASYRTWRKRVHTFGTRREQYK